MGDRDSGVGLGLCDLSWRGSSSNFHTRSTLLNHPYLPLPLVAKVNTLQLSGVRRLLKSELFAALCWVSPYVTHSPWRLNLQLPGAEPCDGIPSALPLYLPGPTATATHQAQEARMSVADTSHIADRSRARLLISSSFRPLPLLCCSTSVKKVKELEPESHGHNLHVKVLKVESVLEKTRLDGTTVKIAEVPPQPSPADSQRHPDLALTGSSSLRSRLPASVRPQSATPLAASFSPARMVEDALDLLSLPHPTLPVARC